MREADDRAGTIIAGEAGRNRARHLAASPISAASEVPGAAERPALMVPVACAIRRLRRETHDTFTVELEPPGGLPFSFGPGQFNMLYVFGVGEVPISISGDPSSAEVLVHTVRAVGTVTKAMAALARGAVLGVRGPFGTRWPVQEAAGRDVVLIAGGIGLAPLRPVVYQILAQRKWYGRVSLLYGTRTPLDILFRKELEEWRSRFDLDVEVTVDRAVGPWHGHVGVVPEMVQRVALDPQEAIAMVCGPEIMMHFSVLALKKRGLTDAQIYLSMERNMKCAVGWCGHCQWGAAFICKDGPVFRFDAIRHRFGKREL